jgi:hypothetical protein
VLGKQQLKKRIFLKIFIKLKLNNVNKNKKMKRMISSNNLPTNNLLETDETKYHFLLYFNN